MTAAPELPGDLSLDLGSLRERYRAGTFTPSALVELLCARLEGGGEGIWIERATRDELLSAARTIEMRRRDGAEMALFGIPFAVKDNIDVAGRRTTAGCPDLGYVAADSATVVKRLVAAGALLVGKTNLDQLATGLLGVRSPYGVPKNPFDERYAVGGSSAGSAAAVARGLVSFALGTDTAGSGRVPAALTNIVGWKPSPGLVSTAGVWPTCRSLDAVSLFALTADDGAAVAAALSGYDDTDPLSEPAADGARWDATVPSTFRFGVPEETELDLDDDARALHQAAIERLVSLGGRAVTVPFAPFRAAAALLYGGPLAAERLVTTEALFTREPEALLPPVRAVLAAASEVRAVDAFRARDERDRLRLRVLGFFGDLAFLLFPVTPTVFTVADALADPGISARIAPYTAPVNVLGLASVVVPAGRRGDGLPGGAALVGPPGSDALLFASGAALHRRLGGTLGATGAPLPPEAPPPPSGPEESVRIAVAGAHLSGEPDNAALTALGARLVRSCRTAPRYRLFCLPKTAPPCPGLVRAWDRGGEAIELEIWELPKSALGAFYAGLVPPFALGTIETEGGERVAGVLCEAHGVIGGREISGFGGWKRFLSASRR